MAVDSGRIKPPLFENDAQEAQWWDEHRTQIEENLATAMQEGSVQRGSAQRLLKEARASKNVTIRMSLEDLEHARQLSAKKGLAYQMYMKMLVHEALDREAQGRLTRYDGSECIMIEARFEEEEKNSKGPGLSGELIADESRSAS